MTVHLVPIADDASRKGKSSKQLQADCDKAKKSAMIVFSDGPTAASSSSASSSSSGNKKATEKAEKKDKMWQFFSGRSKSGLSAK